MASGGSGGQERAGKRAEQVEQDEVETTGEAAADTQDRVGKLTDDVDALLDDIDEALEANAEEFVRGYVQKGGQ